MANENECKHNQQEMLDRYVKDWKIFIDTSSLLHPGFPKFWMSIGDLLKKYNKKVIIPSGCFEEINKHAESENADLAKKAVDMKNAISILETLGFVEKMGDSDDNFPDNTFLFVFTKKRVNYNLLLITQDNNLAEESIKLNDSKAVKSHYRINVKKIDDTGALINFKWSKEGNKYRSGMEKRNDRFNKTSQTITETDDTNINVSYVPTLNDYVKLENGLKSIKLESKIAEGGEGILYTTDSPWIAKIYKKGNITKRKVEKIKIMLKKQIKCDGVCTPLAALYNNDKEFVGYLMEKATGKELQRSVFIKNLCIKYFPEWRKRDTVELCITILKKIKYLHDEGIIIGDINPTNILVKSPKEVYFVDTDSYQIEGYPCPVGTINFTAPEIQGKDFSEFLRTMGNENFAVATLLFMIMLPGKPPYSQQGGGQPSENIKKMDFSYPFEENSNKKTPEGPWRYIWSHLTYELKEDFYNTFRKGGKYSTENSRLTVDDWLSVFKKYLYLLNSGKLRDNDEMSEDLYPTRFKKNRNFDYVKCKLCGEEVMETYSQNGICRTCLSKSETYKCKKCGKEITYTNYQKYIKGQKRFEICHECYERGKETKIIQKCILCGREFAISNNEYDYLTGNGLEIPQLCKICRSKEYETADVPHDKTGRFCFISTVVCEFLGKDDECQELNTLRSYRDNWLKKQEGGPELIEEYYNNAPHIVRDLKASDKYGFYCQYLWDNYLSNCLELIKNKQFEECKKLYIAMYRFIETELNKGE